MKQLREHVPQPNRNDGGCVCIKAVMPMRLCDGWNCGDNTCVWLTFWALRLSQQFSLLPILSDLVSWSLSRKLWNICHVWFWYVCMHIVPCVTKWMSPCPPHRPNVLLVLKQRHRHSRGTSYGADLIGKGSMLISKRMTTLAPEWPLDWSVRLIIY